MSEPRTSNLWLFLELLARRRGLILGVVLVATAAAVIVSLVLPKWFEAEALLLPPKEMTSSVQGMSDLAQVVSVTGGISLPVMVTPSDVYARILKSHAVTDPIIDSFKLGERYRTGTRTETYLALMKHATFRVTEEGLLSIRIEDQTPQTAADMANAFVDQVNVVNQQIVSTRARRNREFIEGRLAQVRTQLDSARSELKDFQEKFRTVDFDQQTKLAIDQATSLKVALAQVELDLEMARRSYAAGHPELVEREQRRDIIRDQLRRLEQGGADSSYFSLPVASIPTLRGQYELLYSRVKVAESLYDTLLAQLEQAKIQESEDTPTISVLDRAHVPELRSRPRRTIIVGGAFGGSVIFAIFLAAILDYLTRLRDTRPEDYRRAQYVIGSFLGWLPGLRRERTPVVPDDVPVPSNKKLT